MIKSPPEYFLVSGADGNPTEIDGIPVVSLEEFEKSNSIKEFTILIAAPELHHLAIRESLLKQGAAVSRLVFFTNELENRLMEEYFSYESSFTTVRELIKADAGSEIADEQGCKVQVYQAKCHVDKPLKTVTVPESYVMPIQVGAALTELSIAKCRDNIGENISAKNPNYCELTATYYAWKNSNADYKGLCHYRRIFDLTQKELDLVFAGADSADVILPYPSIYYPSVEAEHSRYVKDSDWLAMCRALEEVTPEYYAYYKENFEKEQYFYNFNMLIAKKEVFDDYCGVLFSVLERTEQLTLPKGWERKDRFAGYLGENLTTLYFLKNKDKLKIVHAGKKWLV